MAKGPGNAPRATNGRAETGLGGLDYRRHLLCDMPRCRERCAERGPRGTRGRDSRRHRPVHLATARLLLGRGRRVRVHGDGEERARTRPAQYPGRGGSENFKKQDDAWAQCWIACYDDWKAAAARGHDFANHTLHHLGATSYAHAEQEIRGTAEAIWQTNPRQRLQLFLRGGGTTWDITEAELSEILSKYDCVQGRGGGIEDPTWEVDHPACTESIPAQ